MESFRQQPFEKTPQKIEQITPPRSESAERTLSTYSRLHDALVEGGFVEHQHISEMYKKLSDVELIVRREDPTRIQHLVESAQPYEITFAGEQYANCVDWKPSRDGYRNISNAYLEGYGQENAVVTVVGITKTDHLTVTKLSESIPDFYGLDRRGVRSMEGTVLPADIAFVTLRVPGHLFPEALMTEEEKDSVFDYHEKKKTGVRAEPVMIHRGFLNASRLLH